MMISTLEYKTNSQRQKWLQVTGLGIKTFMCTKFFCHKHSWIILWLSDTNSNLVIWACFCFPIFDFDLECWEIIAKKNIWILCKSFFMLDFCHLCFSILNANWSFEKNKYLLFTYRFKVNTIAIERFLIVWEKIKHLPLPFISDCD